MPQRTTYCIGNTTICITAFDGRIVPFSSARSVCGDVWRHSATTLVPWYRWSQNYVGIFPNGGNSSVLVCLIELNACWLRSDHRRSQDFVWGCTFFCQKSWPFLVVALIRLALAGGALRVLWGVHLHIFPVNLAWKKIFHRPGGCRCTHFTPWLRLWVWRRYSFSYRSYFLWLCWFAVFVGE